MRGLAPDRIVYFVPVDGYGRGHAPELVVGLITRVVDKAAGSVNLTLFPDGALPAFVYGVAYSESATRGCWSWPPRAD